MHYFLGIDFTDFIPAMGECVLYALKKGDSDLVSMPSFSLYKKGENSPKYLYVYANFENLLHTIPRVASCYDKSVIS